jgi:hypothetical protein
MKTNFDLIGVILSLEGQPASLDEGCMLSIRQKRGGVWEQAETIPYVLNYSTPPLLRAGIGELVERMGPCRIILGRSITGLAYNEFDRRGFAVFEAEVLSDGLLEGIWGDARAETPEDVPCYPVETGKPGCYELDLIGLQTAHPEISSKQAFRNFLQGNFKELIIYCGHVPPWVEAQLPKSSYRAEKLEDGRIALVIKKAE